MGILDSINNILPGVQGNAQGPAANAGRPTFIEDASDEIHSVEVENDAAMWGKDGFSFADLLDVVNPLQHLPVVGQIYRGITGDEISPAARLAGGTLFGGPVGFVLAVANNVVESATGNDIGENIVAMVQGESGEVDLAARNVQDETPQTAPVVANAAANADNAAAPAVAITAAPLPPLNDAAVAAAAKEAQPRARAEQVISLRQPVADVQNPLLPAQAAPTAALAQQAQPTPAMPGAAPVAPIPTMSPAAFQTLMKSIGAVPIEQPPGRPGLSAGGNPLAMPPVDIRGTSMEVHNMLKAYAVGNDETLQPLKR